MRIAPKGKPKAARPASVNLLVRRAKGGDAEALAELVDRAGSRDHKAATAAVKAIGGIDNAAAWEQLGCLMGESRNKGVTYVASRMLDRAVGRHPAAVEFLIRACENPAIDNDDVGLASLLDQIRDGRLRDDPRVLRIFRRALAASHPYARNNAVTALARLHDLPSRASIAALLGQKKRGADLCYVVAHALVELDGGDAELRALQKVRTRARPDEKYGLDKAIAALTRRLATARARSRR